MTSDYVNQNKTFSVRISYNNVLMIGQYSEEIDLDGDSELEEIRALRDMCNVVLKEANI